MLCLQDGTIADEGIFAIGIADDGSVICGGDTYGAWVGTNAGTWDFVAVKLSANGTEEWRWQVRNLRWFWNFATLYLTTVSWLLFGCRRYHDLLVCEMTSPNRSEHASLYRGRSKSCSLLLG